MAEGSLSAGEGDDKPVEAIDLETGEIVTLDRVPTEFHEAAETWPLMTPDEFAALRADIEANGLKEPITLFDGRVLDGRHRLKACLETGVEPRFEIVSGNPWTHSRTMNRRRDVSEIVRYLCERSMDDGETAYAEAKQETAEAANVARSKSQKGIPKAAKERPATNDGSTFNRTSALVAERLGVGRAAVEKGERIRRFDDGRFERPVRLRDMKPTEALRQIKKSEVQAQVLELPPDTYRVIYADPPWQYNDSRQTGDHRESTGALHHYSTMTIDELKSLNVRRLAADDSVLLCWATFPLLPDALDLVKTWGFKYKTAFVWDKGHGAFGHYHDAEAELMLVATKGSCTPDAEDKEKQIQRFDRGRHSAKPEEWRCLIDDLWPHGPRIELFRRGDVPDGWDVWGAEADSQDAA